MITFACNKICRDKGRENLKNDGIMPLYKLVSGQELRAALDKKLVEEAAEVHDAVTKQEMMEELADVLEVIDGLCHAYGITAQEIAQVKEAKYQKYGGFKAGLFIETLSMADDNPRAQHFRASPDKYKEVTQQKA